MTIKTCPCCDARHTLDGWSALDAPPMPYMDCGNDPWLELRQCGCGSTLALEMVPIEIVVD